MRRAAPTRRYDEKRMRWLRWLGYWGYSTIQVFPSVVGIPFNRAQHAWMKVLRNDGLIQITRGVIGYPTMSVFSLTSVGRDYSGLSADYGVLTPRQVESRVRRPTALHDLAVQAYVAPRDGRPGFDVTSGVHTVRPDAFVGNTAMEIERTPKVDARIYRVYLNYAHLMLDGQIERVEFVFPNEALTDRYRRLFAATEWQDAVLDASGKRYVPTAEPFYVAPDNEVRGRFRFLTAELWLSP